MMDLFHQSEAMIEVDEITKTLLRVLGPEQSILPHVIRILL